MLLSGLGWKVPRADFAYSLYSSLCGLLFPWCRAVRGEREPQYALNAFSLAHYYRYQAIYGFGANAPDSNIVKAEKILQIFKTKNIRQGLRSELYHSCRCNLFPSAKDFYSALDTLAEYGYIAYENVTAANGKKSQLVYVNSKI